MPYDPRDDDGLPEWSDEYHYSQMQKLREHPMPHMLAPDMREYLIRGNAFDEFEGRRQGIDENVLHEVMQSPWFRKQVENESKLRMLHRMLRDRERWVDI